MINLANEIKLDIDNIFKESFKTLNNLNKMEEEYSLIRLIDLKNEEIKIILIDYEKKLNTLQERLIKSEKALKESQIESKTSLEMYNDLLEDYKKLDFKNKKLEEKLNPKKNAKKKKCKQK